MPNDVVDLLRLIATQLYVLNVDAASRALSGKGYGEASVPQQNAALTAANNLILQNFEHQSVLIQNAVALAPKPPSSVGFAPPSVAPDAAPTEEPPKPAQ